MYTNRQNIPNVLNPEKNHPMGFFRFATARKAKLTAAWWWDCRDVYVMSTMHNISASTVLKQPESEHEKKIPCPTSGWRCGPCRRSTAKLLLNDNLTHTVFWRLVDIAIVNSWIIFHINNPKSEINSQKEFVDWPGD